MEKQLVVEEAHTLPAHDLLPQRLMLQELQHVQTHGVLQVPVPKNNLVKAEVCIYIMTFDNNFLIYISEKRCFFWINSAYTNISDDAVDFKYTFTKRNVCFN